MMILERMDAAIKEAMRSKSKELLKVLRTLKSAIKQVQIDTRKELSDDDVVGILKGELKKRQQAKELYITGERADLAGNEQFEIEIIESYLPRMLSELELTEAVEKAIVALSACGIEDMGRLMKHLKEELGNLADGRQLATIVRQKLS
jgi:uncharacterized protein